MAVKTTGAAWGVDHLRSLMGLLHLCLTEVATAIDPPLTQEGPPQIMGEGGRRVQAEVGGACGVVQGGCSVGMYGSGYQRSTTLQVFCICEPAMSVILPLFQCCIWRFHVCHLCLGIQNLGFGILVLGYCSVLSCMF
ncbi:uncharacterized protein LOC124687622 isoform X2 [Lolium rigidum]|uniref:uncharacterized protein LOC124687622 isoform X2 n=1 Tax=Lolium rigidum TaxID=89674 RepID=UPI001F5CDC41|nr:uncharacterized protein LOC124687622 isoform X2 [Lolium rigidum]